MNADDIRREAIERIARARFARGVGRNGRTWDELPDWAVTYLASAAEDVDALGDLLATSAEWGYHCGHCDSADPCDAGEPCTYSGEEAVIRKIHSGCPVMRRYVTGWQVIERSGNPPVPCGTETSNNPNTQEDAA
ncbi:hypothetical protein [Nocardia niwae]|uniref:hypothetical protein n=1 Tax=Nocardia niwae TaxID=626084 RepID=UPI0007A4DFD8|nr:hypothetical protein [Nocardia niwae]